MGMVGLLVERLHSLVRLEVTGDRQISVSAAFALKQKLNALKQNLKVNCVLCTGLLG